MNLALDEMLRRVVSDPEFREDAERAPREFAGRVGVAQTDLLAALDGDLRALYDRGAHPLLIMQLAGALNIDPMDRFGANAPVSVQRDDVVSAAAERLQHAARTGAPCAPVRDLIGSDDVDLAYSVQRRLSDDRLAAGARIVGRKIGLTSPAVQRQLGVDRPDFGVLFDDMDVSDSPEVPSGRLLQPKTEAEVAFVLAADLAEGPFDAARVRSAVAYAVAALEIVDSRIAGWDISFGDTVADNASSGLFVLGERRLTLQEFEPVEVAMTMRLAGEVVSEGTGAACLGDPLEALAWLARAAADFGHPLRAGQVVLSGALGPMVATPPGSSVTADLGPLGSLNATFSEKGRA